MSKAASKIPWAKLAVGAIAVLLAVWCAVELMGPPKKVGPAKADPNACPECGGQLTKGGDCVSCMRELGADEYRARKKARAEAPPGGNAIPFVLAGLLFVLIATHFGLLVYRRSRQNKEEILYYYHCPKCHRKLRYRDTQIGKSSQCPLCKRPFIFPPPEPEPPKEPFFRSVGQGLRRFFSLRRPQE